MSTITKEWLQQKISEMETTRDEIPFGLDEDDSNTLAALRIALASLEAEVVAYADPQAFRNFKAGAARREWMWRNPGEDLIPLFTAPPAPANAEPVAWRYRTTDINGNSNPHWSFSEEASLMGLYQPLYAAPSSPVSVPDFGALTKRIVQRLVDYGAADDDAIASAEEFVYNACRAAMLQGADGNSPVIPDDVRRMDWLVSKTVDVREPMVYGSHSLFWSQAITDEEDDYHATKLREQIDAAMAAEQAAAPQQEVKP